MGRVSMSHVLVRVFNPQKGLFSPLFFLLLTPQASNSQLSYAYFNFISLDIVYLQNLPVKGFGTPVWKKLVKPSEIDSC